MAVKKKKKSTVNSSGNYTKPGMRKRLFNSIKAGGKGGAPASGEPYGEIFDTARTLLGIPRVSLLRNSLFWLFKF